jgi:hypothetical protein
MENGAGRPASRTGRAWTLRAATYSASLDGTTFHSAYPAFYERCQGAVNIGMNIH